MYVTEVENWFWLSTFEKSENKNEINCEILKTRENRVNDSDTRIKEDCLFQSRCKGVMSFASNLKICCPLSSLSGTRLLLQHIHYTSKELLDWPSLVSLTFSVSLTRMGLSKMHRISALVGFMTAFKMFDRWMFQHVINRLNMARSARKLPKIAMQ